MPSPLRMLLRPPRLPSLSNGEEEETLLTKLARGLMSNGMAALS